MSQNYNFSNNLQLTNLQVDNHNTFCDYSNSLSVTDNRILQAPFVNAPNTVSSASQYYPHTSQNNTNTNGQQASNHFLNLSNTVFDSSQLQVNQYGVFKFEIPGFEIIIRPKSNQIVDFNNLNMQSHSSVDSYSSGMSSQLNQNQNFVNGNFAGESYANSDMSTTNMHNNQSFIADNSQYQFQQQNSLGYNSFHG